MERLELLGDSVLKYAVSNHLFLKYPKKHEGQLSDERSQAVSNATLHKRGTDHQLQVFDLTCSTSESLRISLFGNSFRLFLLIDVCIYHDFAVCVLICLNCKVYLVLKFVL